MGNIVLLDDLTINKIAAGEVIERPASVVKEMIENSIDAGAKNITVEIKNGGISLIKITDDGSGISEDDMEIAFERHATSKIRSAEDLATVKSMGFRGEALASIAAIANVEMISKKQGESIAHKIVVEAGKKLEFTEAARNTGTTITVQNLFFNTPVRYKFLKKDYTEAGYIEDVVTRAALVNKNIAIKLISNGKTIIQTNGNGDIKTLIYSIYGKDIASEIIEINYTYEDMKVSGVIGKPVTARGNRSNQLFFLNGRYIKDKNLTAAADQSYKGMIPVGRFGFIVLNIEMDPKDVDVNVHPAKLEVRFSDEQKVFKAVYHAIKNGLTNSELIENVAKENNTEITSKEDEEVEFVDRRKEIEERINRAKADIKKYNETVENKEDIVEVKEKKTGLSGLFQKLMGEPDETEEELTNNHLEEIFKTRQGIQNDIPEENVSSNVFEEKPEEKIEEVKTVEVNKEDDKKTSINEILTNEISDILKKIIPEDIAEELAVEEKSATYNKEASKNINDDVTDKKVSLGNTIISSDTKELDVNVVNDLIKDVVNNKTNFDSTQIVNLNSEINKEDLSKTQIIDLQEKVVKQDTVIATKENLTTLPGETVILNDNINEIIKNDAEDVSLTKEDFIEKANEGFAVVAEKLVETKLNFDNTQFVDTNAVRAALKEQKEEKKEIVEYEDNPEFDEMYKKTFGIEPFSVRKEKKLEELEKKKLDASKEFSYVQENLNVFEQENVEQIPYKFLGIAFSTYIIIEIKNEMFIIDQHAAHERIMYEKVKYNYYSEEDKNEQMLLLPDVISLTHKEMMIAKENIDMFTRAGFSFEEFGENTLKLISVPGMCEPLNTKQLFKDILDEIDTVAVTAKQEKEEKFIATIACKAAVKANMKLEEDEIKQLLKDLLMLPNPFTCPHGRPVAIKMTRADLEKKFSRR